MALPFPDTPGFTPRVGGDSTLYVRPQDMDLIAALKVSGLSIADEAAEALANGWIASPAWHSGASCADRERVYGARYQHLLSRPGDHSTLLASGISEMLTNLKAHHNFEAYSHTIKRGPQDLSYLVTILTSTEKVVGCMRILKNYEPI